MLCPRCNTNLLVSIANGIEIDNCPNCRGVWLDRGELEKIIERSNSSWSLQSSYKEEYKQNHHHHDEKHHNDEYSKYQNHSKHKKGFLSELFDF